jgi:hypothetical protein
MLRVALSSRPTLSQAVYRAVICLKETWALSLSIVQLPPNILCLLDGMGGKTLWHRNLTQWTCKNVSSISVRWSHSSNFHSHSSTSYLWPKCHLDSKLLSSPSKHNTSTGLRRVTSSIYRKAKVTPTALLIFKLSKLLLLHLTRRPSNNNSQGEIAQSRLATHRALPGTVQCLALKILTAVNRVSWTLSSLKPTDSTRNCLTFTKDMNFWFKT